MRLSPPALPVLPAALFLSACCSFPATQEFFVSPSVPLARRDLPDGTRETWTLLATGRRDGMVVEVRSARREERAWLGFAVEEIDRARAEERFLKPYSGLFVTSVERGSPAHEGGLVPGDVVLAVEGTETLYRSQLEHLLDGMAPGREVRLRVRRGGEEGRVLELGLTPSAASVTRTATESVRLRPAPAVHRPLAGFVVGTLPEEWTERLYGDRRAAVLVGAVVPGSPAYLAGLRAGDRILRFADRQPEDAEDLVAEIQERGPGRERVAVEVVRPGEEALRTRVALADFSGTTFAYVPFLFRLRHGARETRWRVGPLELVGGYHGVYEHTWQRETRARRRLSLLLGLFRADWRPEGSRVRLLWLIRLGAA